MTNYFAYNFIVLISLLFAKFTSNNQTNTKLSNLMLYVLISWTVFFVSIRFDVGPDYPNYVQAFKTVLRWDLPLTLDYQFFGVLSKMFSFSEKGYIGVFSVYYLITFILIVLTLKKYNILFFGLLTYFFLGYFFDSMDRIRQYLAISVFLYSISDIMNNKFKSYFIKILIASMFHISAIFLLPVYFIVKIKINRFIITIWFFILLVGYMTGFFGSLIQSIFNLVPYYNAVYADSRFVNIDEFNSGLGLFSKVLFIFIVSIFSPSPSKLKFIVMIGLSLMIIGAGNMSIDRVSDYFTIVVIIIFPILVKNTKLTYNKIFIILPLLIYLIVLFQYEIKRTHFEYKTVFSTEFKNELFYND